MQTKRALGEKYLIVMRPTNFYLPSSTNASNRICHNFSTSCVVVDSIIRTNERGGKAPRIYEILRSIIIYIDWFHVMYRIFMCSQAHVLVSPTPSTKKSHQIYKKILYIYIYVLSLSRLKLCLLNSK